MSQRQSSILTQLTRMSLATAIILVVIFGYTLYHYQMVADEFDNLLSYTTENALDRNDSQMDFAEIVADIQETLADDDTSFMSLTGINQSNLQDADDEWEEIYKYGDKVQGK